MAYVLDNLSLHAGLGWKRLRVDLGVFAGVARASVHRAGTGLTARDDQATLGLGAEDVTLGGRAFSGSALVVFPTVHVDYHVR
jgi:hypothetical protein